ncbi:hypothetical protein MUG91_G89n38 [Manis pentadactyla]|nr:hypothetical protein MUG91_G89n38 [Manis pentadactyla]
MGRYSTHLAMKREEAVWRTFLLLKQGFSHRRISSNEEVEKLDQGSRTYCDIFTLTCAHKQFHALESCDNGKYFFLTRPHLSDESDVRQSRPKYVNLFVHIQRKLSYIS